MKIETLRLLAFRYALGRSSYITSEMVQELKDNWDSMAPFHSQIKDDIVRAIELNSAGHDIDVSEWKKILELMD